MDNEENIIIKDVIRERIRGLHPENCEYCGGYHVLILSRDGCHIDASNACCDEMLRQANKIIRETRKKYGDPYFQ